MTTAPEDLVAFIASAQAQSKALASDIDAWKAELQSHFDNGTITDKLSTPYGSATLVSRVTHTYSPAVKQLQEMEILEGIATKKVSSSWTIRALNP